ncbi:MAG: FHA domain-containing protein [Victivallales bacterium]|nr:FHA domain-containing protein [Victivallales bacterium]
MPDCSIYNYLGERLRHFKLGTTAFNVVIGRASSCDVSLKGVVDNTVSREHIRIKRNGVNWMLESIGNCGVFLNAERIKSAPLVDGSVFRFSQYFLCVGEKTKPSPFDVVCDEHTEDNRHRSVIWPGVNTIGASKDNYITVRTEDVARIHGKIFSDGEHLEYEGIHSSYESAINGVSVGTARTELKEGDELMMAETTVRIVRGVRSQMQVSSMMDNDLHNPNATMSSVKRVAKTPFGWIIALMIVLLLCLLIFILFANTLYQLLF